MSIDFTKFSAEFKTQWETAIEDKVLTQKEISKFSAADQKVLIEMLAGNAKEFEGISIEISKKQDENGTQTLTMYAGKNANEGLLDLTSDTLKHYPNAHMGYLKDGIVTLYDKSGKAVQDNNGNAVRFNMGGAEETKSSFASWYMEHNGGKFDLETLTAMQNLDTQLNGAEESDEDVFDLMRDISLAELKNASEDDKQGFFKQLDAKAEYKKQQSKAMLEEAEKMLYEAHENGSLGEKGEAFFNALMAGCQVADSDIGLTKFKEFIKEVSGLNAGADKLTEMADDGDDANLSGLEETVELLKGAGRGIDSFIGTQGVSFIAALAAAGEAASAAGVGEAFALITHAYFGYEGANLAVEGIEEAVNAETKEEAGAAGEKIGMSAIMLSGTAKSMARTTKTMMNNKLSKMTPEQLLEELGKENNGTSRVIIEDNLRAKGYVVQKQPIIQGGKIVGTEPRVYSPEGKLIEIEGSKAKAEVDVLKAKYKNETDASLLAGWERTTPNSPHDKAISALLIERGYRLNASGWEKDIAELAKTPEGVAQLEKEGLVITANSLDKLGTVYEGQSQSPARAIKKIDFNGSPEEVCAKNPPLQYDAERGKFFREVSWDGGKTKQPMYIEAEDPNGYFLINYGNESWDGALLGGTEAIKSYVEPEAYNANGTKIPVDPSKMGYGWTTASKAAPVRFAKVPDGVKGIVGKEGFQPFTDSNQVVAIDVKGNPYINTVDYVLNNTKGLDMDALKTLQEIDPQATKTRLDNGVQVKNTEAKPKPAPAETAKPDATLLNDIKNAALNSEYDASVVTSMMEKYPDVVQKLAQVKGPNGKKLFNPQDISNILFSCKSTIENSPERLFAILSNPKEIDIIAEFEHRGYAVWHSLSEPLNSTVKANPEAFKQRLNPGATKQSAPSQQLPKFADRLGEGGKVDAEVIAFGNGKLSDIEAPQMLTTALKNLSNFFGKKISSNDIQVIKTKDNAYVSYFDPETNMATRCGFRGQLTDQIEIYFDKDGTIQSYERYAFYNSLKNKFIPEE